MSGNEKESNPPNPNGVNGKPLQIPLSFDEAVKAALETPPERKTQPKKAKARTRARRK